MDKPSIFYLCICIVILIAIIYICYIKSKNYHDSQIKNAIKIPKGHILCLGNLTKDNKKNIVIYNDDQTEDIIQSLLNDSDSSRVNTM